MQDQQEWNPFMPQQQQEADASMAAPQAPQEMAPTQPQQAAPQEWNPFMNEDTGLDLPKEAPQAAGAPPAQAPPPAPDPSSSYVDMMLQGSKAPPPSLRPPEEDTRPLVQKFGEGFSKNPKDGEVPEFQKVLMSSIAQGVTESFMNINQLAADIGTKVGLVPKTASDSMRANYDAEREQYKNIPYIKKHNIASTIVKDTAKFGLESVGPGMIGKAAGLTGSLYKNLAGDALAGAAAGGLEDPGNVQSPWLARGANALVQGGLNAAVSAPFRILGSMRGAPTAGRVAEQQANAEALKPLGTSGTVGQIIGNSNGLMGPRLAATEAAAAKKVPVLGNDDAMYAQQEGLQRVQKAFVKGIEPKAADITALTKQEIQVAELAGKSPADAAIDKVYNTISERAGSGAVNLEGILESANKVAAKFNQEVSKSPSMNIVDKMVGDLQKKAAGGELNFNQLWNMRKQLDDAAFNEYGIKAPSDVVKKGTKELRDAIGKALDDRAAEAGIGSEWKNISKQYMQNMGYKKIQEMMELSGSPLGRGGISPGRSLMTFARDLDKRKNVIKRFLDKDQRLAMQGVIKVTKLINKNLRVVTPGLDVVSAAVGAGSLTALGHMAGGGTSFAAGATIFGLTRLLHSKAGRELLTYAGKQPLQSLKLQQMSMRLFQGITSHVQQAMGKQAATNAGNTQ